MHGENTSFRCSQVVQFTYRSPSPNEKKNFHSPKIKLWTIQSLLVSTGGIYIEEFWFHLVLMCLSIPFYLFLDFHAWMETNSLGNHFALLPADPEKNQVTRSNMLLGLWYRAQFLGSPYQCQFKKESRDPFILVTSFKDEIERLQFS